MSFVSHFPLLYACPVLVFTKSCLQESSRTPAPQDVYTYDKVVCLSALYIVFLKLIVFVKVGLLGRNGVWAEDEESMFLRNAGIYLQVPTVLQPRRPTLASSPPWEPQTSIFSILTVFIPKECEIFLAYFFWISWRTTTEHQRNIVNYQCGTRKFFVGTINYTSVK
jgi:hypothetical protein